MGKALKPRDLLGCCRVIIDQLHRLTGGHLTIKRFQVTETDNSFVSNGYVKLRFTNRGQLTVVIDESIFLLPGESFIEGDDVGPGLHHKYLIRFLETDPGDEAKAVDIQENFALTAAGALLQVRVMQRNY